MTAPAGRASLSFAALVLILAACSHNAAPPPPSTTTTAAAAASDTAPPTTLRLNPVVSVNPHTGLHDGEPVVVTVTGFLPGKVFLSECASAAAVNMAGCGNQLAGQPFVATDETGSGSVNFNVTELASAKPYDTAAMARCRSSCVIVGTVGLGGEAVASAPLSFD